MTCLSGSTALIDDPSDPVNHITAQRHLYFFQNKVDIHVAVVLGPSKINGSSRVLNIGIAGWLNIAMIRTLPTWS